MRNYLTSLKDPMLCFVEGYTFIVAPPWSHKSLRNSESKAQLPKHYALFNIIFTSIYTEV